MRSLLRQVALLGGVLLTAASGLAAQGPGEYPHLIFRDGMGQEAPPPGGPYDNSGVFTAVGGQVFEMELTYDAFAQPNENVIWALLISLAPTASPLDELPPPLFTEPPFQLRFFPNPVLDVDGSAGGIFQLPAGLVAGDVYVQGIVLDSSNAPNIQLSNGLQVSLVLPGFNMAFGYLLNALGTVSDMRDPGVIEIPSEQGSQLKPVGDDPGSPPSPVDPGAPLGLFRLLPILPNLPDGPINPLAPPLTWITQDIGGSETEIFVEDTSGFPTRGTLISPIKPTTQPISPSTRNPWAEPVSSGLSPPNVEYVLYDGLTETSFLNCQRFRVGTKGAVSSAVVNHLVGDPVVGDFTMVSSASARRRTRISLDASNRDAPFVVIPPFTFTPQAGGAPVTMDLNLYLYESTGNGSQGFIVFDRETNTWRVLDGSQQAPNLGAWDSMVVVAPDGRSFVAALRRPDFGPGQGPGGGWVNSDPDQLWAIRTDGEVWPATGTIAWQIEYETPANFPNNLPAVRARRLRMRNTVIMGPDPDNYVLYAALDHKWKFNTFTQGTGKWPVGGTGNNYVSMEWEFLRDERKHRDLIACSLTPPGSTKGIPAMPRPYINDAFSVTGFGNQVVRYDPGMAMNGDSTRALLTGGLGEIPFEEDVFLMEDVQVLPDGESTQRLLNLTTHRDDPESAGQYGVVNIRPFTQGGHGLGGKAALSPDGTLAAWVAAAETNPFRDFIQIARTNGFDSGKVLNVYQQQPSGTFREAGPFSQQRVIGGLQFAGDDHLVFMMGRNPYSDPLAIDSEVAEPGMDLFLYDIEADVMTNLTLSGGGTGFDVMGTIRPGGFWSSDDGNFLYYIRSGGMGPGRNLPTGTAVTNIIGFNVATLAIFDVTGDELGFSAIVPNVVLPEDEGTAPVETMAGLGMVEGSGVQEGMLFFSAHDVGGNGADNVFGFNQVAPFVNFPVTDALDPDVHVSNIVPNPYAAHVAFSRTDTDDRLGTGQHPFVVDMTSFLFERDLFPGFQSGGNFLGRVMDGSFHFIPPSGSASTALMVVFGFDSLPPFGIAQTAAPGYYSLATVSDPVAEPVPVILAPVDTISLPNDFRFYTFNAKPFEDD